MSTRSQKLRDIFNSLGPHSIHLLDKLYDPYAEFQDPVGRHVGLDDIRRYFEKAYKNVISIHFHFHHEVISGDEHVLTWTMKFQARGLKGGAPQSLDGVSIFRFQPDSDLVSYHRDYFDMGEMIYQHIPLLGPAVRLIRSQMQA